MTKKIVRITDFHMIGDACAGKFISKDNPVLPAFPLDYEEESVTNKEQKMKLKFVYKGGKGSGFHGHAGIRGHQGGSQAGSSDIRDDPEYQEARASRAAASDYEAQEAAWNKGKVEEAARKRDAEGMIRSQAKLSTIAEGVAEDVADIISDNARASEVVDNKSYFDIGLGGYNDQDRKHYLGKIKAHLDKAAAEHNFEWHMREVPFHSYSKGKRVTGMQTRVDMTFK